LDGRVLADDLLLDALLYWELATLLFLAILSLFRFLQVVRFFIIMKSESTAY
jgi:hypothetical protein